MSAKQTLHLFILIESQIMTASFRVINMNIRCIWKLLRCEDAEKSRQLQQLHFKCTIKVTKSLPKKPTKFLNSHKVCTEQEAVVLKCDSEFGITFFELWVYLGAGCSHVRDLQPKLTIVKKDGFQLINMCRRNRKSLKSKICVAA